MKQIRQTPGNDSRERPIGGTTPDSASQQMPSLPGQNPIDLQQTHGNSAVMDRIFRAASTGVHGNPDTANTSFLTATSGAESSIPYEAEMEAAFGEDFSGVSAFLGQRDSMRSIAAKAATRDEQVVFSSGAPDKKLVAHELTHVVQQRERAPSIQRKSTLSEVGDPAERQAEAVSARVASGKEAAMSRPAKLGARTLSRASEKKREGTKGGYYSVQAGESLSSVAHHWYGDLNQWPRIYAANRNAIGPDANIIGQGMRLFIPPTDVQGRIADEVSAGMDIANTSGSIAYPSEPVGGQDYPDGYLDPNFWQAIPDMRWSFTLIAGRSAAKAMDSVFQGPSRLECLTMAIAVLARSVQQTVGDEIFDLHFGKSGDSNQNLVISTASKPLMQSKLIEVLDSPEPKSRDDLMAGDWVYFWNHANYHNQHPNGAWGGENAVYKGNGIFSGFGAADKTETEMNAELFKAYNDGLTENEKLTFSQWKMGLNEEGGPTGLDLSMTNRLSATKVGALTS